MLGGISLGQFAKELKSEIAEDNVSNGAAALAYYMMLAVFPAAIFMLSVLPYLPIPNLEQALMDLLHQALPGDAANLLDDTVHAIMRERKGGLVSTGALLTLWAASSGLYAIMQQLNITYDVKEGRPFWKARGIALGLTVMFGALIIGAFALIIFGGQLQEWLGTRFDVGAPVLFAFAAFRWVVIGAALLLAFALIYYFGPDVEQEFRFVSPGSVFGVFLLAAASLAFKLYVANFGKYSATYGSLGAVIILMFWLYIVGLVILLGSEVNALVEHHQADGKSKGEKLQPA